MLSYAAKLSPHAKRYLAVGISVYIFELVVILLAQTLGATPVGAVALSFWSGLIISFLLQKFFTFGDRRTHYKVVAGQLFAFSLLVLFNFGFTVEMTHLFAAYLPAVIIRSLALAITTIWNFYLYKTKVFYRPW